jgi:hypothetical protein
MGMRRTVLLLALMASVMIGVGGVAAALTPPVGELDAQCVVTSNVSYGSGEPIAQTFVAQKTGKLTSVISGGARDGQVKINAVNSLGIPTDNTLASAAFPSSEDSDGTVNFPYKDAASVTAGKRYAIVLDGTYNSWTATDTNVCNEGGFYERLSTGEWRAYNGRTYPDGSSGYDASYRTFVSPPDTIKPTGTVKVDGGARRTTARLVTLNFNATDPSPGYWEPASGVDSMRLKNAGRDWTAWQTYTTAKSWKLTRGAGEKTVYVQYKDHAGNLSAKASDSITYRP